MKTIVFLVMMTLSGVYAMAQDLVYKPINPAFGGDTFNYQWLLNSADSQNKFKEPTSDLYKPQTELERFKENLNNQLLNYISRSLFQQQYGDGTATGGTGTGTGTGTGGLQQGTYVFGSLSVEIYPSNLGVVVNILDITTGEQTQVIIPGN
ncbi:curli assembly protein CsgF [Flavobacterium supellecticarium]|uniref:Curli production assembly/transport component CsgF n=1 Tax=Flavobacterium supellecticarium TaxID=2565924 RepID=A0A4V3W8K9_9FLAO|nr:curli production assembly/transport component CsgF [Flavobacterium supellecticarium]THF51660.1 curli assembly protein CsgF [Flavobacterium supellecticarium]